MVGSPPRGDCMTNPAGLSCEAIATTVLGAPNKRVGDELYFLCPRHDDHSPSLTINRRKNVWLCGPCGASGNNWKLAGFLSGHTGDNKEIAAWLREHGFLSGNASPEGKILTTYDFTDELGNLLFQEVRYQPKDFRLRRPDGAGGWIWHLECNSKCSCKTKLPPVRRVLFNLPEVMQSDLILICEGPKDCLTARKLDFVATTNAMGAMARWLPEYSEVLRGKNVVIICDADPTGRAHGRSVAKALMGVATNLKLIELLPGGGNDLTDYVERGGTRESLRDLFDKALEVTERSIEEWRRAKETATVWDAAEFVSEEEPDIAVDFLEKPVLARGCLTEISGPRGMGKSNFARWLTVKLALAGLRVIYLDRDNPHIRPGRRFGIGAALES